MKDTISNLSGAMLLGTVLPDLDPLSQQRYRVHIPSLMPHIESTKGIWCHNYTSGNTMSKTTTGETGTSTPLQPGMKVLVKFMQNDTNTGYIDKIMSRSEEGSDTSGQDSTQTHARPEDRDRRTVIWKSPNRGNVIYMNEETKDEPNTLYAIFNRDGNPGRATVFRINEDGVHVFTRDNLRARVLLNHNNQIDKDQSWYIKGSQKTNIDENQDTTVAGSRFVTVNGKENHYVKSELVIEVNDKAYISAHEQIQIWAKKEVHIDAEDGGVNINNRCAFLAMAEGSKPKTEVIDLGPNETSEYSSGLGEGCNAAENVVPTPTGEKSKTPENKGPINIADHTMNPEGRYMG